MKLRKKKAAKRLEARIKDWESTVNGKRSNIASKHAINGGFRKPGRLKP